MRLNNNDTVDLLQIPLYQEMVRVFYVDRGIVKWAGMLLSEHSEQLKVQEGCNNGVG